LESRYFLLPTNKLLPAIQRTHLHLRVRIPIIMFYFIDAFVCIHGDEYY
jgi:hypothetical protein